MLGCTLVGFFQSLTVADGGRNTPGKFISFSNLQTTQGGEIFQSPNPSCWDSTAELQPPHEIGALKRLYERRLHRNFGVLWHSSLRCASHGMETTHSSVRTEHNGREVELDPQPPAPHTDLPPLRVRSAGKTPEAERSGLRGVPIAGTWRLL